MLQELTIRDFAIIDQLTVSFENGMTALTGETGAGKSIIIDAVGLLVGGRGSAEFIRTGASKAKLEGLFHLPKKNVTDVLLDQYGIEKADEDILLQRDIYASGRNICRINGDLVTISILREIGETIVDIHGQNEHQELMRPERHLSLLDEYGRSTILPLKNAYAELYNDYQKMKKRNQKKQENEKAWAQRLDMLEFQLKEIDSAELQIGEEESLNNERDRLGNFQKINNALALSNEAMASEDVSALDQIGEAMEQMNTVSHLDSEFKEIAESIQTAYYSLQDASSEILRQIDSLEYDEGRLDEIEKRLELIQQLERKYGSTIDQVLAYGDKIRQEFDEMTSEEADESNLTEQLTKIETQLADCAEALSNERKLKATELQKAIHQQLKALYMEKVIFEARFSKSAQFGTDGIDKVEFYLQTNPGEKMKPLAKIASGGELSRIMLALKTIFSKTQGVTSIIFDEVDTGVSGRVAQAIANKISEIAHFSQVLCITHLPQVAAMSDHEFLIEKSVAKGRTTTKVRELSEEQRVAELGRMLAGTEVTQLTLEHARELLTMAEQQKK